MDSLKKCQTYSVTESLFFPASFSFMVIVSFLCHSAWFRLAFSIFCIYCIYIFDFSTSAQLCHYHLLPLRPHWVVHNFTICKQYYDIAICHIIFIFSCSCKHSCSLTHSLFYLHCFTVPSSCRCGLRLQGSSAAAGHISSLRDQVCLHRKDQWPPGRGDGYLQRCRESKKETTPSRLKSCFWVLLLSAILLSLQRALCSMLNNIKVPHFIALLHKMAVVYLWGVNKCQCFHDYFAWCFQKPVSCSFQSKRGNWPTSQDISAARA